jgi:hypothetical protein
MMFSIPDDYKLCATRLPAVESFVHLAFDLGVCPTVGIYADLFELDNDGLTKTAPRNIDHEDEFSVQRDGDERSSLRQ